MFWRFGFFFLSLQHALIVLLFKEDRQMQISSMNQSQMMILESFAGAHDEQELNDLMDVLRDFYAQRLEREMQRLWDAGTLDEKQLELLRGEHLRTPYHYQVKST